MSKKNPSPNFNQENIVKSISDSISSGESKSSLACQGKDWESVIAVLDEAEHHIGKEISVNSHLNSVMFSDDFNTVSYTHLTLPTKA